jgi:hypothetical protein
MKREWWYLLGLSLLVCLMTAFYFAVTWWLKDPQYRTPQWLEDILGCAFWL